MERGAGSTILIFSLLEPHKAGLEFFQMKRPMQALISISSAPVSRMYRLNGSRFPMTQYEQDLKIYPGKTSCLPKHLGWLIPPQKEASISDTFSYIKIRSLVQEIQEKQPSSQEIWKMKYETAETSIFGARSDTTLEDWTMAKIRVVDLSVLHGDTFENVEQEGGDIYEDEKKYERKENQQSGAVQSKESLQLLRYEKMFQEEKNGDIQALQRSDARSVHKDRGPINVDKPMRNQQCEDELRFSDNMSLSIRYRNRIVRLGFYKRILTIMFLTKYIQVCTQSAACRDTACSLPFNYQAEPKHGRTDSIWIRCHPELPTINQSRCSCPDFTNKVVLKWSTKFKKSLRTDAIRQFSEILPRGGSTTCILPSIKAALYSGNAQLNWGKVSLGADSEGMRPAHEGREEPAVVIHHQAVKEERPQAIPGLYVYHKDMQTAQKSLLFGRYHGACGHYPSLDIRESDYKGMFNFISKPNFEKFGVYYYLPIEFTKVIDPAPEKNGQKSEQGPLRETVHSDIPTYYHTPLQGSLFTLAPQAILTIINLQRCNTETGSERTRQDKLHHKSTIYLLQLQLTQVRQMIIDFSAVPQFKMYILISLETLC
ncbi:hypothetical protein DV515_00010537, partial [Chloebia gouldiae]